MSQFLEQFEMPKNKLIQLCNALMCIAPGAMHSNIFLFNSNIDKIERAILKCIREARDVQIETIVSLPELSDFSYDEEMGYVEHITHGDYGRPENLDEVA